MKKLRKLNLKSAAVMDDNEMKMIVGGSGNTCSGTSSCSGTCAPQISYNGGTITSTTGTCKSISTGLSAPYHTMCTCVY